MVVARSDFDTVVGWLTRVGIYGADTETTGLSISDRLFSIIIADEKTSYYFNFNTRPDHLGNWPDEQYRLPREWLEKLAPVFENEDSLFFMHNAKFDLGMLAKEGLSIMGTVHCTEALERVLKNNILGHKPYSLASCAKRRGLKKDDSVDKYIKEHKLYDVTTVPGKAKKFELKHFDLVPFELITTYGQMDASVGRAVGMDQLSKLPQLNNDVPTHAPRIEPLITNERRLTKVCFRMEQHGIHIDRDYTNRALAHTHEEVASACNTFRDLTGLQYDDSDKTIVAAFAGAGITLPSTPTGRPTTRKDVLDALDNPIADAIRAIRKPQKLISTYYSSFLHLADSEGLIHANIRQGGTETSRFSYSDPNLQNLPKEDDEADLVKPFIVRKCFTPINNNFCYVPIDYRQQEFRMMLDYAGEHELIAAINAGEDVHEATARMLGITRKQAKTINFGLLYGMGAQKLALALKLPYEEACALKALYFSRLPKVAKFIQDVISVGRKRGFIYNWFGFRNNISSSEYAYVLPNHLIQGGCAQVIRQAMVQIDDYSTTKRLRTAMLAQVHDELLFQVHVNELEEVAKFQSIMEKIYKPKNGMRLDCSVEHSWVSWGKCDQIKGAPENVA